MRAQHFGPAQARTLAATGESRVIQWVESVTEGVESVLEFGAGLFAYTKAARSPRRAGIEAFHPYCKAASNDRDCDAIRIYEWDMLDFEKVVNEPYDMALFVDSLEHVEMHDALDLIERCQHQFKKIAVFVPMGEHSQEPCDDNEMQRHLSTWYPADLAALGFEVTPDPDFHNQNPPDKQGAMFAVWTHE